MRDPDFLRTKQFPFNPNREVVKKIKLGIVTKEIEDTNTSLAASATKSTNEPPPQLVPFDKFGSYQKFLRIIAYILRLLPSHECYRKIDGSIIDPTEFVKPSAICSISFKENLFLPKKKISWKTNAVVGVAVLSRFPCSSDQMV